MKSMHISIRQWFSPTYRNLYTTVAIYIDGKPVHTSPIMYGYRFYPESYAEKWLEGSNLLEGWKAYCNQEVFRKLKRENSPCFLGYCNFKKINTVTEKVKITSKKKLFKKKSEGWGER